MIFLSLIAPIASVLTLSVCSQNFVPAYPVQQISVDAREPIDIRSAMATFVDFCYGAAPSFSGVENKALARGFNIAPNGWMEHSKYKASLVTSDEDLYRTCRFTFASNQSAKNFESQMERPFHASEISIAQYLDIIGQQGSEEEISRSIEKVFVSNTEFEGGVSATLFGFMFRSFDSSDDKNYFGVILQTEK
ncbi:MULTISPECIES: hypothetical protein [unclassified Ruegeria]|uniref:hypothetical protein n=1 Tax=unclassified Ruegeria TaxID=2625375 RepID=UPI001ADD1922|nr:MULTISPECIES: hypothetical protein [unclassified Ruegeria]MBO9410386.1 hypothetical protein [Ruegeria sp. R8_1]MBO9414395.1 hypothetical protein [Ruegeria sp. R8_2]